MARRLFRFLLTSGLLLAVAAMVRRTMQLRQEATDIVASPDRWTPILETEPVASKPEAIAEPPEPESAQPGTPAAWLRPLDGLCPATHTIKAKVASGIYHRPGMANYERTKPDRCYADESAAEADGFTKAKR